MILTWLFISDGIRTKLTNAQRFTIKEYASAGCIKRLRVPTKNKMNNKKKMIEVSTLILIQAYT